MRSVATLYRGSLHLFSSLQIKNNNNDGFFNTINSLNLGFSQHPILLCKAFFNNFSSFVFYPLFFFRHRFVDK